jgi:hypothetical protein
MASGGRGSGKYVTIKIPSELYRTLGAMIEGTGFRSVTEFILHVLRDLAAGGRLDRGLTGYSDDDILSIRDRLKALGYLK